MLFRSKKVLIGAAIEDRANADRARLSSFGADFVHNSLDFGLWTGAGYRPASAVWHVGGCVVLDQRADRHDRIFDHGVDRVGVMPETLRELATAQNARRRDVVIQTSGATLPLDVAQATVQRLTDRLLFTYSATEFFMAPAFAWFRGPDDLNWLRPEEGRVIQVVDEHGRECPPGVQGLVRIRLREFDVQSYIEDEQATARAFRDGFCYPGDLGVMRADGRVRLLGRDGDVINIGGQKIPAALIEEGLQMTRELYLSVVLDRAAGKPVIMASSAGGMDIEEVAASTPEKIVKVHIEDRKSTRLNSSHT